MAEPMERAGARRRCASGWRAVPLAALAALAALSAADAARADRQPVLPQVDLPHSYYWRELYLPQLTTGPSSLAFTPDGASLVYSMAGSLWRHRLDGDTAEELTHADGAYDYQPDVAPDGASVVFARYDGRAIELWRLDPASGREQALTQGGDVNVEPRLSPDGRRLAWVSTAGTGHFNLFVADIDAAGLHGAHSLLGERRSAIDRYYYSAFDHTVNPSWSRDGRTLYFVGNAEVAWGSGDLWAVDVADPAQRHRVLREETTWAAHPEPAPTGARLLYSSYRGRPWHQLWLTTADGAAPLPLTFGEFDARNARWSPDGSHIAYISNEHGNTSLVLLETLGGARRVLAATQRRTLRPRRGWCWISSMPRVRAPARASACRPPTAAPMRRPTPGCAPTTASIARASRWRRTISTARRPARWTCRPAARASACSTASATPSGSSRWSWAPAAKPRCARSWWRSRCRRSSAASSAPTCTCT
ncbi:MAG: hypothetical protein U1F06_01865 [Steroidobacteraceae bacterium]